MFYLNAPGLMEGVPVGSFRAFPWNRRQVLLIFKIKLHGSDC